MSVSYANWQDSALAGVFEAREADWRNGAIVYQVLVDRFAPPADPDARRHLFPAPKRLRAWNELPRPGTYLDSEQLWSHEIDFWGGDLQGLIARLPYVHGLGIDVLYLNPIHLAYTNHKYDALDYHQVSPEFGTRDDVKQLADALHARGMKLVLDGVFNHMGRNAPLFQQAQADPASPFRDWFVFDDSLPGGARAWWRAQNLPELNLENPAVREHLYAGRDSVVRRWLRDGADGWRLDVAFDLGFRYLGELTEAAHAEKPGSLVVGEIGNYPREWYPSVDAMLMFTLRHVMVGAAAGRMEPATAARMIGRIVADAGIENALKSWVYLDNHDTPRLATVLPDEQRRRLALLLMFTLPGAANLYYGSELDMPGGDDPEMRAPMRWDLADAGCEALDFTRRLVALRKAHRALRVGDFRLAEATRLIAYERHTDRVGETVFVLANPTTSEVSETVLFANSKLMDGSRMLDLLGNIRGELPRPKAGLLDVTIPPHTVWLLQPDVAPLGGYTHYKRVQ